MCRYESLLIVMYNIIRIATHFGEMAEKNKEGLCLLPISRIKTIMKSSPDVLNISQASLVLITKSTVNLCALGVMRS